ncbi:Holliday junction branch migration protein RuvA [Kistimonas scapharcae]|uniref:Holliday junction branch migration complex subunit RuvA n=1 Tax=Kistimonas scapharcae TaxID=1036133 RepID=A0ABP8UZ52_9GAMM
MIGRLRGIVVEKRPPQLLLDVNGVGYEVEAPMTTFYRLPEEGQEATLYTHFVVREDAQLLYGFADRKERQLFRTLIRVNGVGPKLGLAILSGMESDMFVRCVHDDDSATLTRLPGIGKKTAERLIVEMRDRLDDWAPELGGADAASPSLVVSNTPSDRVAVQDAISALVSLGYRQQDASKAIGSVKEDGLASEELIRRALKAMV